MSNIANEAQNTSQHPLRTDSVEELLSALRLARGNDELFNFMLDVTTPRELSEMAGRLQVARLLLDGLAYAAIEKETGASAATIARVSKCLQYGNTGYVTLLKRLEEGTP
ncbi:MAG: YerC/YecD family TrpR-related protein [Coriobacteriia bacterium]|nr:YerC/YecD family TrpR-related protein [Coriobacteriia bacterium]MCL2746096.1 YerC/YecD family TrpR-related protein [Coriobacteriia bacterium]MCL2870960.1 YerC/YecD family TrpR-related protein [Coriobacteriia bacterium]